MALSARIYPWRQLFGKVVREPVLVGKAPGEGNLLELLAVELRALSDPPGEILEKLPGSGLSSQDEASEGGLYLPEHREEAR
jgi:hypothetical protein